MSYQRYKQRNKKKNKGKSKRGVPIGYTHKWDYKTVKPWTETKTSPRRWKYTWTNTKQRKGSSGGGPPKGYKVMWGHNAIQVAEKVGGKKYKTKFYGNKDLLGFYDPKKRKWTRLGKRKRKKKKGRSARFTRG